MMRYEKQDVLNAIKGSGAVVSTVARKLQCDWHTAKKYCKRWEETQQAMEDEGQTILDIAEKAIYQSIQDGNTQDAKWLLATKGKGRGFSDKTSAVDAEEQAAGFLQIMQGYLGVPDE